MITYHLRDAVLTLRASGTEPKLKYCEPRPGRLVCSAAVPGGHLGLSPPSSLARLLGGLRAQTYLRPPACTGSESEHAGLPQELGVAKQAACIVL